jgi:hypothetical protein
MASGSSQCQRSRSGSIASSSSSPADPADSSVHATPYWQPASAEQWGTNCTGKQSVASQTAADRWSHVQGGRWQGPQPHAAAPATHACTCSQHARAPPETGTRTHRLSSNMHGVVAAS